MESVFLFYTISLIGLSVIYYIEPIRKKDPVSRRKKQAEGMFRENVIKDKLDEVLKERVKVSKRNDMEDKLVQAGFNMTFTEFVMVSILAGIFMGIFFGGLMTNPLLGVMFLVFGFLAPYQVVMFLRNRRISLLEKQIGAFMQMTIKRYENTRDMHKALQMTGTEFRGEEPIGTEIDKTVLEIDLGIPTVEALENMAKRTNNQYLERFAAYYGVASEVGTDELRRDLLTQAYNQYEENRQLKRELDKEISGPVKDAYIMIASVPMFALYQMATNDEYVQFMTKTTTGRIGTTAIIGALILIIWFVNAKIGAPLE